MKKINKFKEKNKKFLITINSQIFFKNLEMLWDL